MLLEAIISMVIFSFLALSLISLLNTALLGDKIFSQKSCALWVAQNQLVLFMLRQRTDVPFIPEGKEIQCGQEWEWKIQRQDTGDPRFSALRINVYQQNRLETTQNAFIPN